MTFLRRLFDKLFSPAVGSGTTVPKDSALKKAFLLAREQRSIDLILPTFRVTQLLVVAGSDGAPGELNDLFLVASPGGNGRMCITVSERERWLPKAGWPARSISGEELLRKLPSVIEITVVYGDGGDFITREQREWFLQELSAG